MSRLPVDKGDPDQWGAILNDFLTVHHRSDGTVDASKFVEERYGVPITVGEATANRRFIGSPGSGTSGDLNLTYFTAVKTETITKLAMYTGGVVGVTITLVRFGVYSVAANGDLALLASTPNDTTLFTTANTRYVKTLSSPWSKVANTRYAVGFLFVGTTVPSVYAMTDANATASVDTIWGLDPRLSGRRVGQSDLPASITAANVIDGRRGPYVECLL